MTSYVTDGTVGPWAREKLECLGKYLHAYTTILKSQSWCQGYLYIDAFAGAGKARLRQYNSDSQPDSLLDVAGFVSEQENQTEVYIHGSPQVALEIKFPFTEYIFIEKYASRIEELGELQEQYDGKRNVTIRQGDANDEIRRYLLDSGRYNWRKYRGVVFLDPFGMQVPWKTIEDLGRTKALEVIINLPVGMAIQRLLPRSGVFLNDQKQKLNNYFGSTEWENVVYEDAAADLFGDCQISKKKEAGKELAKWYQKRLQAAFGHSSRPRLIKNTRGAHLYYLLWAGPNPTGSRIASDVLKQGELI